MSRAALATFAGAYVDLDSPILLAALVAAGVDAELCVWDDPTVSWSRFDVVVIRSTWDYPTRYDEFLAWASSIEVLENPLEVIEYSSDKHYLADLAAHGLAIIPTRFCAVGEVPEYFSGDVVVKPSVGVGSMGAARFAEHERDRATAHVATLHGRGLDVMIQPYVVSVDTTGERALVFIDGSFSHAVAKGAMLNVDEPARDAHFRRGRMARVEVDDDAVRFAEKVLGAKGFGDLLYARVDLVRVEEGWQLMELELVEPSLFLSFDDHAADKLARAIAKRLT